jgi:CRP/FNR family cyclic AMP-dependent transcriptional regulator
MRRLPPRFEEVCLVKQQLHNVAGRLDGLQVANTVARYQPRETVFAQGDRCAGVMYIREGGVRLTVTSRTGRVAVVATLGAGSFFGEGALAGQRRRRCNAETLGVSTIATVKTHDMRRGLHERVALADWFRSHLLARNTRTESDLIDQLFNGSEKRLARALLLLAKFDSHHMPYAPLPTISRNVLADMTGTTRSKVDVLMNKFRKRGFIERVGGTVQVHRSLLTVVTQESTSPAGASRGGRRSGASC